MNTPSFAWRLRFRRKSTTRSAGRRGLTLLEVVLAIAILAVCGAALGELTRLGMDNARLARQTTMAQIYCEGKFAELKAGVASIASVNATPLPEDPEWTYQIDVQPVDVQGVLSVTVTVVRPSVGSRPAQFSVVGWLPDPNFIPIVPAATSTSNASSTSSTGS